MWRPEIGGVPSVTRLPLVAPCLDGVGHVCRNRVRAVLVVCRDDVPLGVSIGVSDGCRKAPKLPRKPTP